MVDSVVVEPKMFVVLLFEFDTPNPKFPPTITCALAAKPIHSAAITHTTFFILFLFFVLPTLYGFRLLHNPQQKYKYFQNLQIIFHFFL